MRSTVLRSGKPRTVPLLGSGALVALALTGCQAAAPPPFSGPPVVADAGPALHGDRPAAQPARADAADCAQAIPRQVPIYLRHGAYRVTMAPGSSADCPDR